jgi:hypothetical protein
MGGRGGEQKIKKKLFKPIWNALKIKDSLSGHYPDHFGV